MSTASAIQRSLGRNLNSLSSSSSQKLSSSSRTCSSISCTSHSSPSSPSSSRSISTSIRIQNESETPVTSSKLTSGAAPSNSLPSLARTNPKLYISLLKPKPTAISTLASRIGLLPSNLEPQTVQKRLDLVEQACTHQSLTKLWENTFQNPNQQVLELMNSELSSSPSSLVLDAKVRPKNNSSLSVVGNSIMGLVGTEYLHSKYPHLPTRVLKAALSAHVGPSTCADVATEMGMNSESGILRWDRDATVDRRSEAGMVKKNLLSSEVSATAMRALIAVIFQELGLSSVRTFIQNRFLSRLPTTITSSNPIANHPSTHVVNSSTPSPSLASFLKFNNPKRVLSSTCDKYGKERPQSRLLAETGRLSNSPVFVVGVYSGQDKLGEGNGSSIRMAEFRAAEDALRRLYLTSVPSNLYPLPSTTLDSTFSPSDSSPSDQFPPMEFKPQPLGESEVVYGSKAS